MTTIDADFVQDEWGVDTYARGINSAGEVIGFCVRRAAERAGGYLFHDGQFSGIDWPDAIDTIPTAINDIGQVVGHYELRPPFDVFGHAFFWEGGAIANIDPPGAQGPVQQGGVYATGINANSEIVGSYFGQDRPSTFVLDHGRFGSIDPPGSATATAASINAAGQIVGSFSDANGEHAFVATPKPVVNGLVKMTGLTQSFDPSPAQIAPAGKFTINATFMNTSTSPIEGPAFRVLEVTGGNLLLNAEGGAAGIGGVLSASAAGDGIASPGESFTTTFVVGLQSRRPFTFLVDVLGMPEN